MTFKQLGRLLCAVILAALPSFANVQVTAHLTDPSGSPASVSFVRFELANCGFNVPAVPTSPLSVVWKHLDIKPDKTTGIATGTIFGNDEILCGGSQSSLYHVTAFSDTNTALAGDKDYLILASLGSWEFAQAQPYTGNRPPPGFQSIFANPVANQSIVQPSGTTLSITGNFDLTNANVIGFAGSGSGGTGIGISIGGSGVNASSVNFGSIPAAPAGSVNVTWQRDALNPANASAYISSSTNSSLGLIQLGGDFCSTSTAAAPTICSLHLPAALGFSQGGTNATSAAAAFNNLAPATSAGGLIIATGPNAYGNLPLGAAGRVLTSNGSTAVWSPAAAGSITAGTTLHLTRYTDGINSILGSAAATDDGTNTTIPVLLNPNQNNVLHVGGGISTWAGSDIGAQINSAYAAGANPGVHIVVDPSPFGFCYDYTTPIVAATSGKYLLLEGAGVTTAPAAPHWGGGACLNYVPTTGNAVTLDYAPLTSENPPTNHGLKNLAIVNNQCSATGGCGGTANGLVIGNTNGGAYDATYDHVAIIGFGGFGYQNTNARGVNSQWFSPFFQANGACAIQMGNLTEKFFGGIFAGNSCILQTPSNQSAEPYFIGTNFFSNTIEFDFSLSNISDPGHLHLVGTHNESSAASCAHFIQGQVDWDAEASIFEDDNATGTCDWMFSNSGSNLSAHGITLLSNRAYTNIFLMNSPSRGSVSFKNDSPTILLDSAMVGGANAAFLTLMGTKGGSSNPPSPWIFESQLQPTSGVNVTGGALAATSTASVDFSGSPTVVNSTTGTGSPSNATCLISGQEYFQTDGTAGQEKWFCKSGTWSQQLNSGASGASTTLNNLGTTAINAALLPSGTQHLGSATAPWADIFLGSGSGNTLKLTGTFTGNRVVNFPDAASETVAELGQANVFSAANTFNANVLFGTSGRLVSGAAGAPTNSCVLCFGSADRARYGTNSFNLIGVTSASSPVQIGDTPGVSIVGPLTTVTNGQSITIQPLPAPTNTQGGATVVSGGNGNGVGSNGDLFLAAGSGGATGTGVIVLNSPATVPCANAPGGTTLNGLVSYSANGCVNTPQGTTTGIAGVCIEGCGTTGTAKIVRIGIAPLLLDNTGTQGDYVCISTSANNQGHDCSTPNTQTVGTVKGLITGSLYNVDINIAGGGGTTATGAVVLAPAAPQTIQATSPTVTGLIVKAPASAGASQVVSQQLDNTGANIFNCQQNGTCQIGTGVGGSMTLSHVIGPNTSPAGAGIIEASDADVIIGARNHANNADLTLTKNISDVFAFNAPVQATKLITSTGPVSQTEISDPGGTASSLVSWGDSTTHWPSFNPNNVGTFKFSPVPQVNTQSGTTYTVLSTDVGKLINFTNGSAIAVTLPQSTGVFSANFCFYANAGGAGTVTITPTTSTINGAASLALSAALNAMVCADGGGNYIATVSSGGGGSGDMIKNSANVMGASGTLNGGAMSVTAGLTFPKGAGAAPTADGVHSQDTTLHLPVFGNGTSTRVYGGVPVNTQSGTSYTILTTDANRLLKFGNAAAVAVTLPQAGASFPNGWMVHTSNTAAGLVTITPTTSTIDGGLSVTLTNGQSYCVFSDGSNYFTGCKGAQSGLGDPGGNGFVDRTAANVTAARTLTGTANQINITNGGGGGNPVFSLDTSHVVTDSNSITKTNLTLDAEGTGNVITRPFYIEYTAGSNGVTGNYGSFDVPTTGNCTASTFGTTTTQGALDFVDASTTVCTGHLTLPQGWTGSMDARIFWFANASSANAVRWSVQTGCVADTEAVSTGPSYNTASASNTAYTGTALQRKTTTLSALDMTNCSAGETMYFQLARVGGDAGDTLTATAEAISLQFEGRTTK